MKLVQTSAVVIAVSVVVATLALDAADARRYRHRHHRERPRPRPVEVQAKPSFPASDLPFEFPNATGSWVLDNVGRTGNWNVKIASSCL